MSESQSKIDGLALDAAWGRRSLRAATGLWRVRAFSALALAGVVVLSGCSSAIARRDRGPVVTDGPTWAGMLATAQPAGWEASRRDAALAPRAGDAVYPLDQWPRVPQSSLDRVRYLSIPRTPHTQIFTRQERVTERGVTIWR